MGDLTTHNDDVTAGPSGYAYDLDLTYISERLIAMGYPSDGAEALYRNKYDDVRRFLDDFHPRR